MARYTMLARRDQCLGCQACEIACKQEHGIPVGPRWMRVITFGPEEVRGRLRLSFNQVRCMHCGQPPCIDACPTNAISKRADGIVLIDDELCIGCGACLEACPFAAPQFNPEKGTMEKCDLCVHRVDEGLKPACVLVCPTGTLIFGDAGQVSEEIRRRKTRAAAQK